MTPDEDQTMTTAESIAAPHAGEQHGQVIRWEIDRDHSDITFAIKHLMISTVRGRFNAFQGYIDFNPDRPTEAAIYTEIDVASIDTGSPQRDEHLRSADFFDAETYPTITFVSQRVEPRRDNHFNVIGDLTMHGVTREVTLDAKFEGIGQDPWGNSRAAFTANTTVNREDFGLTWNAALETGGLMVGKDVKISLDIQTVRKS
jgi:polyisoprenoid-binding protein YceI